MDKNTIIGFVLIALVLIGFSWYNQPTEEEIKAQQEQVAKQEAKAKEAQQKAKEEKAKEEKAIAQALTDTTALFHSALSGTATDVVLQNDKLALTLSTKGGTVTKAVVKGFKSLDGAADVTLFEGKDQQLNYILEGKESNIRTADLYFTPSEQTDSTVTMTATAANGKTLSISYLLGKDYLLHVSMQALGMDGLFSAKTDKMSLVWEERCKQQEKGHSFENYRA